MSSITKISTDVLKVHPRNQEFFDDISGEDYEQFKSSIKEDGIISEIIVAPDMTILSGHQRFKAAKELGMETVPVRIREDVQTEDEKLRILLAANFGRRQNDSAKQRKVAAEYVALCGYRNGDNQWVRQNGGASKLTLKEIAAQLGTTERSLQRSLRIERDLSEDMKQLLEDGVISETLAADVIAAMTEDEQLELLKSLDATKKYTAREIQPYIDRIKSLEATTAQKQDSHQVTELNAKIAGLETEISGLKEKSAADQKTIGKQKEELESLRRDQEPHYSDVLDSKEIYAFCNQCNELIMLGNRLRYSEVFSGLAPNSSQYKALGKALEKLNIFSIEMANKMVPEEYVVDVVA